MQPAGSAVSLSHPMVAIRLLWYLRGDGIRFHGQNLDELTHHLVLIDNWKKQENDSAYVKCSVCMGGKYCVCECLSVCACMSMCVNCVWW